LLGLKLRKEFLGRRLEGTAIELANERRTGATQQPAADFLEITWPSRDLLMTLEAVGSGVGQPVVLIGERGRGKSHLMAVLVHVLREPEKGRHWLQGWADRLGRPDIGRLPLLEGRLVVAASLHRQRYKTLWDLLFTVHPRGEYARGRWSALGKNKTEVPPLEIVLEMLREGAAVLILDEFQTWFESLSNSDTAPHRSWAFNFIQILADIANENPELLTLLVSVRNGSSEAYRQLHRVNPRLVDFKGPTAEQDRRQLLLHRLFQNRMNVPGEEIDKLLAAYAAAWFKLYDVSPSEHGARRDELRQIWPFSPQLMRLLEDQVLVATDAQETRDLIRILAGLYKVHGEKRPILTPADFRLDEDAAEVGALLDSVASESHRTLREKARRNLVALADAVSGGAATLPHAAEVLGSLWIRSLAQGNLAGAEPRALQLDVTRDRPLDENGFAIELETIVDNSFNVHPDGGRLVLRHDENAQAKLKAFAKNQRNFADDSDLERIAAEVRHVLYGPGDLAKRFRVVVLGPDWESKPWQFTQESDKPERWDDRIPLLVLPQGLDAPNPGLGIWLKAHLQRDRNAVRFLLPRPGTYLYYDEQLRFRARASLTAAKWGTEYLKLQKKFQGELHDQLKDFFDRFAVLDVWSNEDPAASRFHSVSVKVTGSRIPEFVDEQVSRNLFVQEDFQELVLEHAARGSSIHQLLDDLREPRPKGAHSIVWTGETDAKEQVLRLCAAGLVAINNRGSEFLQRQVGEAEEAAWQRMKGRLSTGTHLRQTLLLLPQAVPQTGARSPAPPSGPTGGDGPEEVVLVLKPEGTGPPQTPAPPLPGLPVPAAQGGPATLSQQGKKLHLIGAVESSGILPTTRLRSVSLRLEGLTGAQLNRLLISLPETPSIGLEVERESEG
jgi:hypothetical protein